MHFGQIDIIRFIEMESHEINYGLYKRWLNVK